LLYVVLIGAGFVLGFAVGRWWAALAVVPFGLWAGLAEEVEVPGVVIGVGYGALAALGIAIGVLLRRA
jgi:hypothetical protein